MKKLAFHFTAIVLMLLISTSSAFANNVSDAKVYQLLDKSGITKAIESLPIQIQGIGQQMALTAKDPQEHQELMKALSSTIDTDKMMAVISDYIRTNTTQAEIDGYLSWLDSDLAARMVKAELQSSEPDFQQQLMTYMAQLQTQPPAPVRTQAIINYVESSGMVEQTLNLITTLMGNMFEAVKALNPEDTEMSASFDQQIASTREMMRAGLEQQMILTSYYIYRDFSNNEINEYASFYQREQGEQYLSLVWAAMSEGLNQWGVAMVTKIEQEVKNKSS